MVVSALALHTGHMRGGARAVADPVVARGAGADEARSRGFSSAIFVLLTVAVVGHASAEPLAARVLSATGCAPAASHDLRVYLINEAGALQETLDDAKAEAGAIWASAGVRLVWTSPPVPLDVPDGRTAIVIVRRVVASPATVHAADSQVGTHSPLGWVNFGGDGRPGYVEVSFKALTSLVMSGSYLDRPISTTPSLVPQLLGRGLGRVMAHELGHWLMGREHTRQGLMRPGFNVSDVVGWNVPKLPRTWTAASSELRLALSSHCEPDASRPSTQ